MHCTCDLSPPQLRAPTIWIIPYALAVRTNACGLQKRGLEATGILASMSKAAGFSSVSDLLQKNPAAKRPQSASVDPSQPKV